MSVGRKLSRRRVAEFVAERLVSGDSDAALQQAAAYMIETKQKHAIDLLIRDIEEVLSGDGTVIADITSARELTEAEKDRIARLFEAKKLYVRETIDPKVLGGIKVEAAGKRLDATLKHRIDLLKETKL